MGVLECENVFELVVPDGWTVTGTAGQSYDLAAPAGYDLAVTISVYDRMGAGIHGKSAVDLVREFAASAGADRPDALRVVAPTEQGQERAFVKFVSEGDRFMAGVLFFGRSAVLASANTGGTAEDLELGERLVASIGPLAKRRGLFRR